MPSRKEMEAFLLSEGWHKEFDEGDGTYFWYKGDFGSGWDLEEAYRIAQKRKAARERRRLKAAGWFFSCGMWFPNWYSHHQYTRAEAIQTLAEGPKPKAQGSKSKSPSQKGPQ